MSLLCAEIGVTWYLPFEGNFILWLQSLAGKGSFLYYLMNFVSMFGEELILVAVLGVIYWGIDKRAGERIGAILLSATVFNPLIKNAVCRTRPFDCVEGVQNFRDVDGYSFPSGHSSGSASLATACSLQYGKKHKWVIAVSVVVPLLVALSRNYLGAHFLTDVIAGLLLGVAVGLLVNLAFEKLNKYIVYGILLVIGAAGLFYCHTTDYFTAFGLMLGYVPAMLFEEKVVKFENTRCWWRILLRLLVGGGIYLLLNVLIKLPFNSLLFDADGNVLAGKETWECVFRVVRYAIIAFVTLGLYPMLFKPCGKLWRKLKFIK